MEKKTAFNFLLAFSLIGNAVFLYSVTQNTCTKTDPFGPALIIESGEAYNYYEEFKTTLVAPDVTTGGVISRAAFEEMLCMDKCNGISYSFVRDKRGAVGPENSGAFVVFEGVNVTFDAKGELVVNPIPGSLTYRPGNWCPPSCMKW